MTLNYGVFINTIIDFVIVAFAIFLLIKQINRLMPKPADFGAAGDEGLPLLQVGHRCFRHALPALHVAPYPIRDRSARYPLKFRGGGVAQTSWTLACS